MLKTDRHPYIEFDEHIGIAKIYFPQLMRELNQNKKNYYSFCLIEDFSRKYLVEKHPIITLIEKIKAEKLDFKKSINLLKRLYNYYERIYKYHYPKEFNPYEDKSIFNLNSKNYTI
ncbi:hypothetical protein [Arcobacter peruensis]|uniref:hypothetical protein n=1 Tax=Arcobacter peruensis TaxID=2320140 RepID=UPI000F08FD8A|nr:hypothetical protein [Arcobacter peruensis]